jgi:hypothetical protein
MCGNCKGSQVNGSVRALKLEVSSIKTGLSLHRCSPWDIVQYPESFVSMFVLLKNIIGSFDGDWTLRLSVRFPTSGPFRE